MKFRFISEMTPSGDQPKAIKNLVKSISSGVKDQVLLGVTGSGKTFTIAKVIEELNRPTLVISHNKTLAAQLYSEFATFFPYNSVEYFISYYDYYQPEAYIPSTDTYIAKDASVNKVIDQLRLKATASILSRRDTIIVASVSCIYNIGSPALFKNESIEISLNEKKTPHQIAEDLVNIHYTRNDFETSPGKFRIKGDVIDIFPAYDNSYLIRLEFFGDEIEKISRLSYPDYKTIENINSTIVFPAKHYLISSQGLKEGIKNIKIELKERLKYFKDRNKLIEEQRLEQRTLTDIEMINTFGYCSGIENYSRHISNRPPDSKPWCLIDYFPKDFLLVIDESHVSIPQFRAMQHGDRSRKKSLIDFGFRLPSAYDNRPLRFEEFEEIIGQTIFMSATPREYEIELAGKSVFEQIVRPTGLIDPEIEVIKKDGQIDRILSEVKRESKDGKRVLITTLTKRMAEELSDFMLQEDIKVTYLHSEIKTLDRIEILRNLRLGKFDVLIGVNLLREGLDLPEVSLVIILDADKEGFLRSSTSLIQTAGRAARNLCGKVLFFADKITNSMRTAINETNRRRIKQIKYNEENKIIPKSIYKTKKEILESTQIAGMKEKNTDNYLDGEELKKISKIELMEKIVFYRDKMKQAAENLDFEKAAKFRDISRQIKEELKKIKV